MDFILKLLPFYLLTFWWLMCIFYKVTKLDREDNIICIKAAEIRLKPLRWFLCGLLDCELCMESWIGLAFSLCLVAVFQDCIFLLYAPSGAAFSNLIKTR